MTILLCFVDKDFVVNNKKLLVTKEYLLEAIHIKAKLFQIMLREQTFDRGFVGAWALAKNSVAFSVQNSTQALALCPNFRVSP